MLESVRNQYWRGESTFLHFSFMKTWDVHFINKSSAILFTKISWKKNREKLAPLLNIDSLYFSAWFSGIIHPHQYDEMQHFMLDKIFFVINQFKSRIKVKNTASIHNSFTFHQELFSALLIDHFLIFLWIFLEISCFLMSSGSHCQI